MDAIYIITPKSHIVDCIMAEFEQRRYRGFFLIWTTLLPPQLKERIDRSQMAREQIRNFQTVHLDYHPRESHLITFKDPWSFPMLYHPACNPLVVQHMQDMAEKVCAGCTIQGNSLKESRLSASASPLANTPSFDTTDRETPPTKLASSAHISRASYKTSWTCMQPSTPHSRRHRTGLEALSTSRTAPWT
jgi:hypothetical protein